MFKLTLHTLYSLTVPTFVYVPFSAKPRPSKKAKLNKPADDNPTIEPEKISDQFEPNVVLFLMIRHRKIMKPLLNRWKMIQHVMLLIRQAQLKRLMNRRAQSKLLMIKRIML